MSGVSMNKVQTTLVQRLSDSRSKKVVFLSQCILNENVRYLGGACRKGCMREIVEQCVVGDLGMVQMPCPEQHAWGGVLKKFLRLAGEMAGQIKDYITSGFLVVGIVGIDGSPSCAVSKTLNFHGFDLIATVPVESITVEKQNTILRECVKGGRGIFIDELQKELKRRRINVPYLAHDLLAELDGKKSKVELGGADSA